MVVALKTASILLLAFSLYQCTSGQPHQQSSVDLFNAVDNQNRYLNEWHRLRGNNEIIEGRHSIGTRDFPIFRFTGENVRRMKVKEVFIMLQNWLKITPNNREHRLVEMNLGGSVRRFRLYRGDHEQILFATENNVLTEYDDIAKVFDDSGQAEKITEQMLTSSLEPLNAQTEWTNIDANVQEHMVAFMVISQVAEAARPTDEFLNNLRSIVVDVLTFETLTEGQVWQRDIKKAINKLKREDRSFRENIDQESIAMLLENPSLQTAAREVAEGRPDSTFTDHLPPKFQEHEPAKMRILEVGKSVIEIVNKRAGRLFRGKIRGLGSKNGRIPGADKTVRSVLRNAVKNRVHSFNFQQILKTRFVQSLKGGTQKARLALFQDFGNTVERPFERPNVDLIAARNGEESIIKESIAEYFKPKCGPGYRRKRQPSCSRQREVLVEDSLQFGDTLRFETIDEDGRKQSHEIMIDLDELPLSERTEEYIENLKRTGLYEETSTGHTSLLHPAETALGTHGAIINLFASIHYFSEDDVGNGAFSASQAAHGIGGLSGANDVVAKVTRTTLKKAFVSSTEKVGLKTTVERVSEVGAKALGNTASKTLSRFSSSIPFVGLAFDAKFIADDIKELQDTNSDLPKSLRITHLILDIDTTVLTLIESIAPVTAPVVGPLILATTIIRLGIDDFYLDISEELSKVEGKGFGAKVDAVLKGIGEGVFDALTLGFGRQRRQLYEQVEHDRELLRNLSNPASYFDVSFTARDSNGKIVGTADFTHGLLSDHGGFLTFTMNDNGSFTVEFPEVPTEDGGTKPVKKLFTFNHPVNDVVLGIGQLSTPRYAQKTTKLFLVIPIDTENVISGFENHQSSQQGAYYGNSHDNNFFALQATNQDQRKRRSSNKEGGRRLRSQSKRQASCAGNHLDNFTFRLQSYHYDLFGRGGNDNFFLGPQTSRVVGGSDNDYYHIPSTGGSAIIDNFAFDEEMDTLLLDVNFADVLCARDKQDLLIRYCQSHSVKVENWFSHGAEKFYRHLHISTADGVDIDVAKSDLDASRHRTVCAAVSVDKSRSTSGVTVSLTGSFSEVKFVRGSNYSDTIIGNDKPNILSGGLGYDQLQGGNGADTYVIQENSGTKVINNFASDNVEDLVQIGIPYVNIGLETDNDDVILYSSANESDTRIELTSWFNGEQYQHITFISGDHVMFVIDEDNNGTTRKHPLSINLGENEYGVVLDLMHPENCVNITVNSEIADEVKSILDSPYDDQLIGNVRGNFFLCSGGSDFLQGNGGKDTYKIDKTCKSATINNFDEGSDYDLLLWDCPSSSVAMSNQSSNLKIVCSLGQSQIVFKQWFDSIQYQHVRIKTSDKITAFLPENLQELEIGHLFPIQIEKDEDCEGEHRDIDLSPFQYSKCERFLAKTDTCSYSVTGNSLKNYIDPGPGNLYGYQRLKGLNGTDTYVMGHRYGIFNVIDNFAEDSQYDHLLFKVLFQDIEVTKSGMDLFLSSMSVNDSVRVQISNYYLGESYQHLLVYSADNVLFKFAEEFPYIEVIQVDFSPAEFSQVIVADDNSTFKGVRIITGSSKAENYIVGGSKTTKITGGSANDTIIGGSIGEDLFGGDGEDTINGGPGKDVLYGEDGNDYLDGGEGDDLIYAGLGADTINGSLGTDTILFSGYNFTGVVVNLQVGLGWDADAEGDSYYLIENIGGSDFDDTLTGDDLDNTILGHGGDDFINPAGGDDVLRGGRGADIYYLNDAFGHKLIDNFATDSAIDLIVANISLLENSCYHFLGSDLQINFNFRGTNITEAIARLTLNEEFLMVTIPLWLENSTNQHMEFSFLDGYRSYEDYQDTSRQIQEAIDIIVNETLFQITGAYETMIDVALHYEALMDTAIAESDHVSLHLVHFQQDLTTYYPLSLSPSNITRNIRLDNLTAGNEHSFSLLLSSCGLTVAISPLVMTTTLPSAPSDVTIQGLSEGFHTEWVEPSGDTNPFFFDYVYGIVISSDSDRERFESTSIATEFSVINLIPQTAYNISICSTVYGTSNCYTALASTSEHACSNLQNLSSTLVVGAFQRNERGEIYAFVSCTSGVTLVGNHHVICNDTESPPPHCRMFSSCQLPPLQNAEKTEGPDIPRHADRVTWSCIGSYWIEAGVYDFSSVCIDGEWSPPIQSCVEKPTCMVLELPQYGNTNSDARHVDDVVSYSCNTGYVLNGPEEKTCTINENGDTAWLPEGTVTCHALECTIPPIPNSRILSEKSSPSHGDIVQWKCDNGYWISPGIEGFNSTCLSETWSPPIQACREKPMCEELGSPPHGSINSTVTGHYVGSVLSFMCELGYARNGSETRTCTFNQNTSLASWEPAGEVTCSPLECELPSSPNAVILVEVSDPSHNDIVEWGCQEHYWVSPGVTEFSSTCSAGQWDPPVQSCMEKPRCSPPPTPPNGSINSTAIIFHVSDTISYSCEYGYSLQGAANKECSLGDSGDSETTYWSPKGEVNCNAIECTLPSVTNAIVLSEIEASSNPVHGYTVYWGCRNTYWVSNGVIEFNSTCTAGSWTPDIPSCVRKPRCSNLAVTNGRINSTARYFYVDDYLQISCNFGYYLEGDAVKNCQFDESTNRPSWSPEGAVTCNPIECSLPTINFATRLTRLSNPSHSDTVVWHCWDDYWISPNVSEFNSTCLAGQWDPPVQRCMEKPRCFDPSIPRNGSINSTASEFHVGDAVSYSCDAGYRF